jgi:hypothetical protein
MQQNSDNNFDNSVASNSLPFEYNDAATLLQPIKDLGSGKSIADVLDAFHADEPESEEKWARVRENDELISGVTLEITAFGLPARLGLLFREGRLYEAHLELKPDSDTAFEIADHARSLRRVVGAMSYLANAPLYFRSDSDDAIWSTFNWSMFGVQITMASRPYSDPPISIKMLSPPAEWDAYVETLLAA